MRIIYKSIYGHLLHTPEEGIPFQMVRQKFSWLNPDRFKIEAFRKGYWDGTVNMINDSGAFLRGLAPAIVKEVQHLGCEIEYEPLGAVWAAVGAQYLPLVETLVLEGITLMEHQRHMTRELLRNGGGTVEGVTGAGKTESITLLARILSEYTNHIFFLVHRIGLMRAACDRVKMRCPQLAPYCGLLGDGERPALTDKIIFSTVQTLNAIHGFTKGTTKNKDLEKLWSGAGAIIIDEAHRVSGDSYLRVLRRVQEAPVFQFTGTPEVDQPIQDWTIIGMGGPIVARVTRPEMEKIGFIAEAIACTREFSYQIQKQVKWMPEKRQESYVVKGYLVEQETGALQDIAVTVDKRKGIGEQEETCLYPDYARDMLILQAERNADIAQFVQASLQHDRPVLILCEKIAQLYYLRGVLSKQLKSNIGIVHGAHSVKMRRRIVEAFESGDAPILLASTIFDEGEDIRNIGSVVLAAGGASLVRIVQRIGRGIRAKDSTRGNYCPIWLPIDHLTRYSREHTEARLNYLARAQITIEECTTDWVPFFSYLHSRYQKNVTRI